AGGRLRATDLLVTVGALADMEDGALEIDVRPAQPTEFTRAQAGEDRSQQQRPPDAVQVGNDRANFRRCRDVDPDPQFTALARVGAPRSAAQAVDDVLRHQPALLGVGDDRAERAQYLAHQYGRAVPREPILELTYRGHR